MPIIKQSKQLDGSNSIYRAARKTSARQLQNMKSVALDTGESEVQSPIPTFRNKPDNEGLVPKLLQNVSDINGLLTSLRMVGEAEEREPEEEPRGIPERGPRRPKRPRQGAGRSLRGGALSQAERMNLEEEIARDTKYISKWEKELVKYRADLQKELSINPTTPEEKKSKSEEVKKVRDHISRREKKITDAQNNIRRNKSKLEEDLKPAPLPKKQTAREALNNLINDIKRLIDQAEEFTQFAEDIPPQLDADLAKLLGHANAALEALDQPPSLDIINYRLYDGGRPVYPLDEPLEEVPPPPPEEQKLEEYDVEAEEEAGDEIPPQEEEAQEAFPIPAPQEFDDEDADEFVSRFDFSTVNKSTLLVILNQLKSLIKAGEIILKKIVNSHLRAGEADLNTLTDELAEMISIKRFLYTHINQIMRKSKELGSYLRTILSNLLGKYIEALKIYVKRYAQLNIQQINNLQETVDEIGDEIPERDEPELGAGRSFGRSVVLSDAVKRISKFDRKYIL